MKQQNSIIGITRNTDSRFEVWLDITKSTHWIMISTVTLRMSPLYLTFVLCISEWELMRT